MDNEGDVIDVKLTGEVFRRSGIEVASVHNGDAEYFREMGAARSISSVYRMKKPVKAMLRDTS